MRIRSKPKANNQGLILEVIFMEANGFDDSFGYIYLGYFNTESTALFLNYRLKHLEKVKFD